MRKFQLFLRDRDAKIIEFFFLALNTYILILLILPPYTQQGGSLLIRFIFQITATGLNLSAVLQDRNKIIRTISAVGNAAVMALITITLILRDNANAGTYGLLALLAVFVCWKINLRS